MLIPPQLLLIFNEHKEIERTIFLTYSDLDKNSYTFNIYNILKQTQSEVFLEDDYIVMKEHISLFFNIENTKGYICNILNISRPIILFSLTNNLEYYYDDYNKIFNPFINNNYGIRKRNNEELLYHFYNNIFNKAVFCITYKNEDSIYSFIKENGSTGYYENKWRYYINKICNNINLNNYNITSETKIFKFFKCDLSHKCIVYFLNDNNYITKYLYNKDNILTIAGNNLTLDNIDEIKFIVYLKENNQLIFIYDKNLNIYDYDLWNKIPKEYIDTLNIKNKQESFKTIVKFDIYLKFIIDINIDFDFIIKATEKTKNIYSDISNKLNIITSKDHISFRSTYYFDGIPEYLTLLILGYSNITNKVLNINKDIKINNLYVSRFCQNTKNKFRKPILSDSEFDKDMYIKLSDNFYRGKIINGKKISDIYINDDNLYFKCKEDNYIGFLENMNNYGNKCVPCCYNKNKDNLKSFNKCVYGKNITSNILNIYIQKTINENMRIIFSDNQLGELSKIYSIFLNKYSEIIIINNRISSARNYFLYKKFNYNINIITPNDLIQFVNWFELNYKNILPIIFYDSKIYISKIDLNVKYNFFIVIKNKIHEIINISKKENDDNIIINEIDIKLLTLIINTFKKHFNNNILSYKNDDLNLLIEYNYNNLYINNNIYDNFYTTYFVDNIIPIKYDIPYNIDNIETNNKNNYILTLKLNSNN